MFRRIKQLAVVMGFALMVLAPVAVVAAPSTAFAAGTPQCEQPFLTLPSLYRGMTSLDGSGNCYVEWPSDLGAGFWRIILNVIDIALNLVVYVTVFFIIIGGFSYMTSEGDPKKMVKAKGTIVNAIIALVISIASIAIVNLIFSVVG